MMEVELSALFVWIKQSDGDVYDVADLSDVMDDSGFVNRLRVIWRRSTESKCRCRFLVTEERRLQFEFRAHVPGVVPTVNDHLVVLHQVLEEAMGRNDLALVYDYEGKEHSYSRMGVVSFW